MTSSGIRPGSAWVAQPNRWTYNMAKGAVAQLTRCAALELGEGEDDRLAGELIDRVSFVAQTNDVSQGRFPDGSETIAVPATAGNYCRIRVSDPDIARKQTRKGGDRHLQFHLSRFYGLSRTRI